MAGIDRVEVDNMSVQFFEGVEKLLEIWFTTSDGNNKNPDLRKIPRFVFTLAQDKQHLHYCTGIAALFKLTCYNNHVINVGIG